MNETFDVEMPDGTVIEGVPVGTTRAQLEAKLGKQQAPAPAPAPAPYQPYQGIDPGSDTERFGEHPGTGAGGGQFHQGIASTPARLVKSIAQMAGQDQRLPEFVNQSAQVADTGFGTAGRIVGDVAATAAPVSAFQKIGVIQQLNAAKGLVPAMTKAAGTMGYGAASGAALSPDQQAEAARLGALGTAIVPGAQVLTRALGKVATPILGMTTGAGGEAVKQAFKGGPEFVANMRGNVEPSVVVNQAREGVQRMRQQMYDNYAQAKGGWAGDAQPLNTTPIAQAFDAATKKFSFQGMMQPGAESVQQQVAQTLGHWRTQAQTNPAFVSVEGLDALKRHLQDLMPDFNNRTGRAYVTEVVNSVKDTITRQKPEYATAMKDYWERSNELDELTKSLSLGDKATVDTALRKLQSLTRNNVSTNYGQRMVSADALKEAGADVMPAVAGQAMNTWTPRGLTSAVAAGGGGIATLLNPMAALAMPAFSPRMVGEAARGAGAVINDPRTVAALRALRMAAPTTSRVTLQGSRQDEQPK
jgi:hypothetical protein